MNCIQHTTRNCTPKINCLFYSINIEDVQNVAEQELERQPTEEELRLVEDKVGDYINWYESILNAITELKLKP